MSTSVEDEIFIDKVRHLASGRLISSMFELALGLEVFAKLKEKRVSMEEFSSLFGVPIASARMLAQFLCKEGLLVYENGLLANAPAVDRHLSSPTRDYRDLHVLLRLNVPVEALKARLFKPAPLYWYQLRETGAITDEASLVASNNQPQDWLGNFFANNNERRVMWGENLASRYDFGRHKVLLDVAGASGGWCIGIRQANPHLRCIIFDLPMAREAAEQSIASAGESENISFAAGSFFEDELPRGADVALLANVLHNWTPEDGMVILRKIFDALPSGGVFLLTEYFFEDDWTGSAEAVFEAFVMVGEEGRSGWQPSYGEVEEMMAKTGFTGMERQYNLVIGHKP
jgi:SAM-dependent methyltransferase